MEHSLCQVFSLSLLTLNRSYVSYMKNNSFLKKINGI
jgi:hypothetical protein